MSITYRPTSEDKSIIRDCAKRSAGKKRVEMNPGLRYNIDGKYPNVRSLNIAMVSDHSRLERHRSLGQRLQVVRLYQGR